MGVGVAGGGGAAQGMKNRTGGAGGGPGHALGPLKSAEKPHPWAVDHEPMGPGAMGSGRGRVRTGGGGWGLGWSRGHF